MHFAALAGVLLLGGLKEVTLLFLRLATGLLGSFLESAVFWSSVLADLILEQFSARSALKTLFLELCSLSCVPGVVFIFLLPGILLFVLSRHLPVLPRSPSYLGFKYF